jgi:hypothetical protein
VTGLTALVMDLMGLAEVDQFTAGLSLFATAASDRVWVRVLRCKVGPNDASWPMHPRLWEYSDKRLKLAQLLSRLGIFPTRVRSDGVHLGTGRAALG